MIEQPLQMRSLPSWLGQGTEQHDKYKEKKKISKVCVQSQNNPQPSTLKNSSATIKVNMVKRFEGLVIKVLNRIVIIFIL